MPTATDSLRAHVDRLSAQDMSMLWPDDFGWPQDIGVIGTLDARGLVDPEGRFRIEKVRQAIEERLPLVPRFRQVIRMPRRGLGRPLWIDVPRVDLEHHVRAVEAGEDLLTEVERIRRRPFDRTRPLWEVWFLTGLPDGRVGCFVRAHHAIADGVAGLATLAVFFGSGGVPPDSPVRTDPSARELLADNLRGRWRALASAASHVGHPRAMLRGLRDAWPALRDIVGTERVPRLSLNRPLGPDRGLAVIRARLDVVKEVAHTHDATVNDVLLAAIAGGLRDVLLARGEPVDVAPRAFVPIALRRERSSGNRTGMMMVSLPVGVADPAHRLRIVAAETAVRKAFHHPAGSTLMPSPMLQRFFLRLMAHQRWANAYLANVPGPAEPLHIAGTPLLELFPLVPLIGNVTLGVGALSYAGQLNLTVVADATACPDVDVFTEGLRTTFTSLPVAGGDRSPARPRRRTSARR